MNSLQYFGVVLLLLSIAVSEKDIPDGDSVRVPRALVLKPVVKVKTHDDEDDGPFDFIADWLQKLMNPGFQKPTPSPLRLLVPNSGGVNNELYIEHMQPSQNTKSSFVIIRMTTDQGKGMGGVNNLGPINGLQTTPFYPKPIFPSGSTRIIPKPGSNFFTATPTMPTWPRIPTPMNYPMGNTGFDFNHFHQNYGHFNNRNYPNFKNNYASPKYPPPNYYNYKPFHTPPPQSFHPFAPHYNQQSGYGMNADMHNSISGMNAGGFHYGMDSPFRGNNYPGSNNRFTSGFPSSSYPRPHNNDSSHNLHSVGSEHVKVTLENVDLASSSSSSSLSSSPSSSSSSSSSSKQSTAASQVSPDSNTLDQFNRLDRMISTSPTYTNRPWQPVRQQISSTTPRITGAADVRGRLDKDSKYSSREIQEIASPNLLNSWKAFVNSNNNVDKHNNNVNNQKNNADSRNNNNNDNHVMKINNNFDVVVQPRSTEKPTEKTRRATPSIKGNNNNNQQSNENELLKARVTEMMRKRHRKVTATTVARRMSPTTSTTATTSTTTSTTAPASTIIYKDFFTPVNEEQGSEPRADDDHGDNGDADPGDEMMNASNNHVHNVTLSSIENVMNLTATALWRHKDIKRPSKNKLLEKLKTIGADRKVRIVESVKSSVSVTSSKGPKRN